MKKPPPLKIDGASEREIAREVVTVLPELTRRDFLKGLVTLGGLSLATGVVLSNGAAVEKMLRAISRWNDGAQGALFDPKKLAQTYPESMMTRPFPFNAFYGIEDVPVVDGKDWKLELGGLVKDRKAWDLPSLRALPQEEQVTRLVCVEGWSAIGKWGGIPLGDFLRRIGADTTAKYVGFGCFDGYRSSIDMASALHPQTILALTYDGKPLPPREGFPLRLRIPTKLGFKNPKHIASLYVTNSYPGGYWEDQGYNWFSGL
ncbi:MAG: molybdopterin-dependent oxidoreductase [Proteobacteria bacterium]|nr:molybdopterin-dependent oxidoreductase [Pseudomonadota bacterium]